MLSFPPHVVVRDVTNPSKLFLSDSIAIVPISSVAKSISGRQAVYSRYFVRGRSIRDARFLRAEEEVIRLLPCRIYLDDHVCRSGHFISFIIENSCAVKRVELCLLFILYSSIQEALFAKYFTFRLSLVTNSSTHNLRALLSLMPCS